MEQIPSKKGTDYEVGYKKPPKEHQVKPGEVLNPNGPPKAKVQLWRYFCDYMELSTEQLKKEAAKSKLSMSRRAALKLVEAVAKGKWPQAKEILDRTEGKVLQGVNLGGELGAVIRIIDTPMTKAEHDALMAENKERMANTNKQES